MKKMLSIPQIIFYAIATSCWDLCKQFLQQFTAFNSMYDNQYIIAQLQKISDAKAIMTETQRNAAAKVGRLRLVDQTVVMLRLWQTLKVYINRLYTAPMAPAMVAAAGGDFYANAADHNWEAVGTIAHEVTTFLNNERTFLESKGMPATFADELLQAATNTTTFIASLDALELQKGQLTAQKNAANAEIYKEFMAMLNDGKRIFLDDIGMRHRFTLSRILAEVRGHHSASLRGLISDINKMPIVHARIYSENAPFDLYTNKKGRYTIPRIAAGTYYFIIDCPGYIAQEFEINIRPGIANTLNVTLEASQQLQKVA